MDNATMNNEIYSVLIWHFNNLGVDDVNYKEYHDLTYRRAMEISFASLYKNGKPVGGVRLMLRTKLTVVFAATNPLLQDGKSIYPKGWDV